MLALILAECPLIRALRILIVSRVECDLLMIVTTYPAYERGLD